LDRQQVLQLVAYLLKTSALLWIVVEPALPQHVNEKSKNAEVVLYSRSATASGHREKNTTYCYVTMSLEITDAINITAPRRQALGSLT